MRWLPLLVALAVLAFAPAAYAAGLDVDHGTLTFSQDVADGASGPQTSTVTNNTGSDQTITVTEPTNTSVFQRATGGNNCANGVLQTGFSCTITVQFDPSAHGDVSDSVSVSDGVDPPTVVQLQGTGTYRFLQGQPSAVDFGSQGINDGSTEQSLIVMNNGTDTTHINGDLNITGDNATDFQLDAQLGDCTNGTAISKGTGCTVHVKFDPSTAGSKTAALNVPSDSETPLTVDLTGTGTDFKLTRSPASLHFTDDIHSGPSQPQTVTVTNAGSDPVTISNFMFAGSDFNLALGQPTDCSPGETLQPGDTCKLRVVFDPTTTGLKTTNITVNSTAPPISVDVTGLATEDSLGLFGTLALGALDVGSGTSLTKAATLRNTTLQPIKLTKIRLLDPNAGRFLLASGLNGDCAIGQTLGIAKSCKVRILFVPQAAGPQTATLAVASSAGISTLPIKATGEPGLRVTSFKPTAASTKNRRLAVPVRPLGGAVSNIVVTVTSQNGKALGTGTLATANDETKVRVRLKSALKPGTYVAQATGRDAASHVITAPALTFEVR